MRFAAAAAASAVLPLRVSVNKFLRRRHTPFSHWRASRPLPLLPTSLWAHIKYILDSVSPTVTGHAGLLWQDREAKNVGDADDVPRTPGLSHSARTGGWFALRIRALARAREGPTCWPVCVRYAVSNQDCTCRAVGRARLSKTRLFSA